jgi:ketosteroid isomerase-like protein
MIIFAASAALGQADVQKIVDAEHAFAAMAAEKGAPPAFLAFMTGDALAYVPEETNAKAYWSERKTNASLLAWAPNYADISSNGLMGYTTGNWEFRPKGKDDAPTAFGDFVTVWLRQTDGSYKWVVDMGVSHAKPAAYSTNWVTSSDKSHDPNSDRSSAADTANGFQQMLLRESVKKAYELYAADDLRLYRENELPFLGKKDALKRISHEKGEIVLAKKSNFFGSADLAYTIGKYSRTDNGRTIERGSYMQIWKLKNGKWKIVLDVFKPVPESGK